MRHVTKLSPAIWGFHTAVEIHFAPKMEAAKSSETLVSYRNTAWPYNPEDLDVKSFNLFYPPGVSWFVEWRNDLAEFYSVLVAALCNVLTTCLYKLRRVLFSCGGRQQRRSVYNPENSYKR
jgi:hypothetical protein